MLKQRVSKGRVLSAMSKRGGIEMKREESKTLSKVIALTYIILMTISLTIKVMTWLYERSEEDEI